MKILITSGVRIEGEAYASGDVVEVGDVFASALIRSNRAVEFYEPKSSRKKPTKAKKKAVKKNRMTRWLWRRRQID